MKLILTINSGTLEGEQFDLETGHLTIGRSDLCSIKFDPFTEKIASKQHAFIESRPDGFYLTDNNSTNGTLVNGQKIQSIRLNGGDIVQFGRSGITANVLIESYQTDVTEAAVPAVGPSEATLVQKDLYEQNFSPVIGQTYAHQQTSIKNSVSSLGLGHLEVAAEKNNTGKYIGIAITIFVIVFLSLIVTGIMFLSLGPVAAIIASVVAFVPAVFYILPIVWLDRYDPEPFWLLGISFAWGALVAIILSMIINDTIGMGVASIPDDRQTGEILGFIVSLVISAPIFEEITKGLGLLGIVLFFRKYFDGILDGIIFAGVIALGFATVENVLYYGRALLAEGSGGLLMSFFARGILSPFAHVTFTAMTGIGFGISRESHNKAVKFVMPIVGLICAIGLHMFWNGSSLVIGILFREVGLILTYLLIEVPLFVCFVGFAFWIMSRQKKIIREMLAIDVARGLISQDHFERATSAFRSSGWLISSIINGKYRATSRYIRAIGKLGLSYWHIQRATAARGQTASFQQNPLLRQEILRWKDKV